MPEPVSQPLPTEETPRSVNWVFVCREGATQEFDASDLLNDIGGEQPLVSLKDLMTEKLEELKGRRTHSFLEGEKAHLLGTQKWTIETNEPHQLSIKSSSSTSGWVTLVLPNLARRTVRITLFITPKYLQVKPKVADERQYNDLALRFIKTVLFSKEKNHRTFFEKNLAQISSIIPLRLLVPYFVDELSEVIENGPGLPRQYTSKQVEKSQVVGRINYGAYVRQMYSKPHMLPQVQTELSVDNLYAQFLLGGLEKAMEVAGSPEDVDGVQRLLSLFDGVSRTAVSADRFDGVDLPATLQDYRTSMNLASMFLAESIAVLDTMSKQTYESLELLYASEYIFEGVVTRMINEAFGQQRWRCENDPRDEKIWTEKDLVEDDDDESEEGQKMKAKTDHVLHNSDGRAMMVFESKHTKDYIRTNKGGLIDIKPKFNKKHAEQLIVSMIAHSTLRGMITTPLPDRPDGQKILRPKTLPTVQFPPKGSALFQYQFASEDIPKPKIFLMYIDMSVLDDHHSQAYRGHLNKIREEILAAMDDINLQDSVATIAL